MLPPAGQRWPFCSAAPSLTCVGWLGAAACPEPTPPLAADGILDFLKNSKPEDALCVLGLTLDDLYPHETWRFTFSKFLPGHGERHPLPAPAAPPAGSSGTPCRLQRQPLLAPGPRA